MRSHRPAAADGWGSFATPPPPFAFLTAGGRGGGYSGGSPRGGGPPSARPAIAGGHGGAPGPGRAGAGRRSFRCSRNLFLRNQVLHMFDLGWGRYF